VVGLDIGTTKICAIIADVSGDKIEIIGVGTAPSTGLRKGVVINLDETTRAIEMAIADAERMAGIEVSSVYAGISGEHIECMNKTGVISISRGREVTENDVTRVISAAKEAVVLAPDREIIHLIPQEYIIDGQDGIKEPIGMSGVKLEVKIHVITGAITPVQNVIKCINRAGFEVEDLILNPLAASRAVLTKDEKELGIALIDIGGGTTDIAIFSEGRLSHTQSLSIGGWNVTKDISIGLRMPSNEAEKIKIEYGCALTELVNPEEKIEVVTVGDKEKRVLPKQVLAEIIEPRVEEIFYFIEQAIRAAGYEDMIPGGLILGGGGAMLNGTVELAEKIFGLPVRIGKPFGVEGLIDEINNASYAAGVGLVLMGTSDHATKKSFGRGGLLRRFLDRIRELFG
jgi:cell division protein FtsA